MLNSTLNVGSPRSRVDGRAKVTGAARYAAEFAHPGLLHGVVVSSAVAKGRIAALDTAAAAAIPGVVRVFTHENRLPGAWRSAKWQDEVAPPGSPFRPLENADILFSGQPIALVVAEDFATAQHAASLVRMTYEEASHATDIAALKSSAYDPPKKRTGIAPPPKPRGDVDAALAAAPVRVDGEFRATPEHHNPMEPHASTVIWEGVGRLTVHDKIQGAQNSQGYIAAVFGLKPDDVRVISPFVGGAFGSGLRPHYQLHLATMAALALERSVRVELTRDQMFTIGHRPDVIQTIALGAEREGTLTAIKHDAISGTSTYEDYQEVVVNWSSLLYRCDNVESSYRLAQTDLPTPLDMRAPGAPTGLFAIESALDELAAALGMDPLELRLKNYSETDPNENKNYTSKELREAYRIGAERFGWKQRSAAPRSMRDGRELVGWGMASGVWEAMQTKTSARVRLNRDGTAQVGVATADIGTGTYTILSQIAADTLGIAMDDVTVLLGDSTLPTSPVEGGSWTAASAGAAVQAACETLREKLFRHARAMDNSPLRNMSIDRVTFADGRIAIASDRGRFVTIADAMAAGGVDRIVADETTMPNLLTKARYSSYTHSAVFAEVRIDEELGVIRVTRLVDAVAAGRIINPKTARSQIIGGVVFGIGMALHEESMIDHTLGRIMNHNFAEYHVPANADVPEIEVVFVEEHDAKTSPLGVKGLGEIGICGTAAAIANAVCHATGKRVRDLPITIDKLLDVPVN